MPDHSMTLLWSLSVSIKDFGALIGSLGVKYLADSYGRLKNKNKKNISFYNGCYYKLFLLMFFQLLQKNLHPHSELSLCFGSMFDVSLQNQSIL